MHTSYNIRTVTARSILSRTSLVGILALPILWFACAVAAQQPFQDAKGASTIFVQDGGFAQVNVADPSIRIGFLRNLSKEDWFYGAGASGKLTGTKAGLINKNELVPDAQGNFVIGLNDPFSEDLDLDDILVSKHLIRRLQETLLKSGKLRPGQVLPQPRTAKNLIQYLGEAAQAGVLDNVDVGEVLSLPELKRFAPNFSRIAFQGGYAFKQYTLFDAARAFDEQVYKKNFHSPSAQLIYFRQLTGRKLIGASAGIERSNNSTDLTEIEVRDFTTETGGGTTREAARIRKALRGDFRQHTRTFVNADFVWFPSAFESRVGFNVFARSTVTGENKGIRPGIGLFISEKGSPTRVVGGVSVVMDENGKANVSLTAGYNF
jgi:hypothetical protein